jgi:geranylgeranyl pyrophosphate synthase
MDVTTEAKVQFGSPSIAATSDLDLSALKELPDILLNPTHELISGQSKKVRANLLLASAGLCHNGPIDAKLRQSCDVLSDVMERLHAGSLIIDDIQDGADFRRGKPALHTEMGVPLAINAGNWLYFEALRLIPLARLEPDLELQILRWCHQALFDGHIGQAADVGVCIDEIEQSRVASFCETTMILKSGALMSLASATGALVGGATAPIQEGLRIFGQRFGCALQMFNDLCGLTTSKQCASRDLSMRRPSWIWLVAAQNLSKEDYQSVRNIASLRTLSEEEKAEKLRTAFERFDLIDQSLARANQKLDDDLSDLSELFIKNNVNVIERPEWQDILRLSAKIRNSYERK